MHKKSILKGAAILTLASIITKIIGFVYRIYMTKLLGSEGMGLYQLIFPLYLLCWAISSSGLCTTMSKLTAQEQAKGAYGNVRRLLCFSLLISVSIATLLSVLLHHFSYEAALYILKDSRANSSLKIISGCFPFMAAGSTIRGYFLGNKNMTVSAVSQVTEQLTRILTVWLLSSTMAQSGIEKACSCAIIGMAVGEVVSFIYALISYIINNRRFSFSPAEKSDKILLGMLLAMAVPLTLNRIAVSLFSTAENILLPQALVHSGLEYQSALSLLGELTGMAMPLVMFPSSLLSALATATMPSISESDSLGNSKAIASAMHQTIVFTAIIAMGTTGLLICYPNKLSELFHTEGQLTYMLRAIAPICPFIYLQVSLSGILNGLGEQLFIFIINLISSLISIGFIVFAIPIWGLNGFLYGWFFSAVLTSAITLHRLKQRTGLKRSIVLRFVVPTICITISCILPKIAAAAAPPIIAILMTGTIYLTLLFISGYIKLSDLTI